MADLSLGPGSIAPSERVGLSVGIPPVGRSATPGSDRRPARRFAVGTPSRSRDASAVTGAAQSELCSLSPLFPNASFGLTPTAVLADSSHLALSQTEAPAATGPAPIPNPYAPTGRRGRKHGPRLSLFAHRRPSRPARPFICGPPKPKPLAAANLCSRYRSPSQLAAPAAWALIPFISRPLHQARLRGYEAPRAEYSASNRGK